VITPMPQPRPTDVQDFDQGANMTQIAETPPGLPAYDPRHPKDFRTVVGRFATGLTVVTAMTDHGPVGFTCQSFSSLSLDPPLITICPSRTSTTWPQIAREGRFCVNVLGQSQEWVSARFATSGADKYAGVAWSPAPSGAPVLEATSAWLDCTVEQVHDGGDHEIVLGRVTAMGSAPAEQEPLLFHRGQYARLNHH
jgi:flavin reductase (DIM6/NTAB) family NADH-FMN oxidoreductase RutF